MLDKLSAALKKATDKVANALFLDKGIVEGIVKDLQRSLIEADVNVKLVMELSERLRKAAYEERPNVEKKSHLIKKLYDEIRGLMGESRTLSFSTTKHTRVMLVGLYGAGKTTTIAKLAHYYAKRGFRTAAISLDVHRPAAALQLKQACAKLNVQAFVDPNQKDPVKILKQFDKELKEFQLVFIDTAGRDALDAELIKELKAINKQASPDETFLVIPADIGQTAKKQAETFKTAAQVTGVIITRMDSTAKAGGALTACAEVKAPIVFIGTGEKPSDLEQFNPDAFVSRLLGEGDLSALLEKVQTAMQGDMEKTKKNIQSGKFTLKDFQAQLDTLNQVGSFDKILGMIPGLGKANVPKEALEKQQAQSLKWKHAINSMTPAEQENPDLLEKETSRMARIAKGSGVPVSEVRSLLKQYKLLRDMLKSGLPENPESMDQKTLMKMAKKMKGKFRF